MTIYKIEGNISESCPVCGATGVLEKDPYDLEHWVTEGRELDKIAADSPVKRCKKCEGKGFINPHKVSAVSVDGQFHLRKETNAGELTK